MRDTQIEAEAQRERETDRQTNRKRDRQDRERWGGNVITLNYELTLTIATPSMIFRPSRVTLMKTRCLCWPDVFTALFSF